MLLLSILLHTRRFRAVLGSLLPGPISRAPHLMPLIPAHSTLCTLTASMTPEWSASLPHCPAPRWNPLGTSQGPPKLQPRSGIHLPHPTPFYAAVQWGNFDGKPELPSKPTLSNTISSCLSTDCRAFSLRRCQGPLDWFPRLRAHLHLLPTYFLPRLPGSLL